MVNILSKEGSKLHLVNQSDQPLCFGLNRSSRNWTDFKLSSASLEEWVKDSRHCYNCESVFRFWAYAQFQTQIIAFVDRAGFSAFPHEFLADGSYRYGNASLWPNAKIVKGDGYKHR